MSIILKIAFLVLLMCLLGSTNACSDNEGYCQTHWDCCSGKCMTYLNRCAQKMDDFRYPHHQGPGSNRVHYSGPVNIINNARFSLGIIQTTTARNQLKVDCKVLINPKSQNNRMIFAIDPRFSKEYNNKHINEQSYKTKFGFLKKAN